MSKREDNGIQNLLVVCGMSGSLPTEVLKLLERKYFVTTITRSASDSHTKCFRTVADLINKLNTSSFERVLYIANSTLNQKDTSRLLYNWEILNIGFTNHLNNINALRMKFPESDIKVIFVSSLAGIIPLPGRRMYSLTKELQIVMSKGRNGDLLGVKSVIIGSLSDGNPNSSQGPLGKLWGLRIIKKSFLETNSSDVAHAIVSIVDSTKNTIFVPRILVLSKIVFGARCLSLK